jgi:tetratricopeptide (TPR) repeat protein
LNKRSSEKALSHYEKVLKKDPNHLEALLSKAQCLLDMKKPEEASTYLKGLTKKNPQSAAIWYYYGRTEHFLNRLPTAAQAYEKAFDLRPNFAQAGLAWAMALEQQKKDDAALKAYELVFEKTQDLNAAQQIATLYISKEKYKESIPFLETLVANDAEDLNHQIKLALVYLKVDDYEKAKKMLTALHTKQPDSDKVNYYLSHLQERFGDFESAFKHAKMIPADSKYFEETRLNATFWLRGKQKNDEAKAFIEESIKMNPGKSAFYVLASSMDEEKGNIKSAVSKLEEAKKRFKDDEKILYYLGVLYEKEGKVDAAIGEMEQILVKNPNNADAMNFIGYTWTTQGKNLDRVQELLSKAMKINPENAYIVDSWGWFLHVRGKTNDAVAVLEKAANMKPDEPAILEHLGDVYSKKNFRTKALKVYESAKQFVKDETLKSKLSEKINVLKNELAQQENGGSLPTASTQDAPRNPASQE